jgi:chromosome segregation ATPase
MESLKRIKQKILEIKSPFSQTKNTVEHHSSRLDQVEDRVSELENKIEIKQKKKQKKS